MIGIVDGTIARSPLRQARRGRRREARRRTIAFAEQAIADVKQFDRAKLDPQEQITYDVLLDFYGSQAAFRPFDWLSSEGLYPISPMFGTQVQLASFLQTSHVVKNEKTARNYVARLQAMGGKLDALTAEMQRQSAAGVVLPSSLLERSLVVIDDTIAPSPEESPLVTSFVERMAKAEGLDETLRAVVARRGDRGRPDQRLPGVRADARGADRGAAEGGGHGGRRRPATGRRGLLPGDAAAVHDHRLHARAGARSSASRRWRASTPRWTRCCKSQGLETGTVAERMTALRTDPRFLFENTEAGREQVLARYREILDDIAVRMPEYFQTIPPGKLAVERIPASAEKGSASAYYNPAALDGSRPGTFYANLRDTSRDADLGHEDARRTTRASPAITSRSRWRTD